MGRWLAKTCTLLPADGPDRTGQEFDFTGLPSRAPSNRPFYCGILEAKGYMRNFHLPLPEQTYTLLRAEAERAQLPATTLARQAIDAWLKEQKRKARHHAIAGYAAEMAGTELDLDRELESAGIEHLVRAGRVRK